MVSTHGVRAALQQHVDGSVHISVAVVQRYHRLVLVLPSDVN